MKWVNRLINNFLDPDLYSLLKKVNLLNGWVVHWKKEITDSSCYIPYKQINIYVIRDNKKFQVYGEADRFGSITKFNKKKYNNKR